jgi:uncharacterized membrane protein YgcG
MRRSFPWILLALATLSLPASADPSCKRLDNKALRATLIEADRSFAKAVAAASDPDLGEGPEALKARASAFLLRAPETRFAASPSPLVLYVARKRAVELLAALPSLSSTDEKLRGPVAAIHFAAWGFLNRTTPLLSHYNCELLNAAAARPVAPSGWGPWAPTGEKPGASEPAQNSSSAKPRLYSSPNGGMFLEGGSSSSGTGGACYEGGSSSSGGAK